MTSQTDTVSLQNDVLLIGVDSAGSDVELCNLSEEAKFPERLPSLVGGHSELTLQQLVHSVPDVDTILPDTGASNAGVLQCFIEEQGHIEKEVKMLVRHQHHQMRSYESALKASLSRQCRLLQAFADFPTITPKSCDGQGQFQQAFESTDMLGVSDPSGSSVVAPYAMRTQDIVWQEPEETPTRALRSIFEGLRTPIRRGGRSPHSVGGNNSVRQRVQNVGRAYRHTMIYTEPQVNKYNAFLSTCSALCGAVRQYLLCRCEWLQRWVEFESFHCVVCAVIALNCLYIGLITHTYVQRAQEDYDARRGSSAQDPDLDTPAWIIWLDAGFNAFFVGELLLRMLAYQGAFFAGDGWRWNVFDFVIAVLSVGNMFLLNAGFGAGFARLIRLARVGRSLSVIRMVRFSHIFSKIRLLTLAVAHCGTMLLWAVLFLAVVLFFFAVIFANGVATHLNESSPSIADPNMDNLRLFFGSLPMAMLTLFMSVSGGVDWWEVAEALLSMSVVYVFGFLVFMSLSVLAILNVISAIFVNDAMETASMDLDLRLKGEVERTRLMVQTLTDIFNEMSVRGEGVAPYEFAMKMESQDMKLFCSSVGLYFTNYNSLFQLLDVDDNGLLGIDEFVIGFLRLGGGSMMVDMEVSMRELKVLIRKAMVETWNAVQEIGEDVQSLRRQVFESAVVS